MQRTAGARHDSDVAITRPLAEFASTLRYEDIPADALAVARHCLLDVIGVTLAGMDEPLVTMLREQVAEDGGNPQATLIGHGGKVSTGQAALVNGSAAHALDFDDVLGVMTGHPTVPVMPAALALGEWKGLDGKALLTAFVAGVEIEGRLGASMGDSHYARGWHATGTFGTFGAAAACARMLGLDPAATARALGIAGTSAAGLKSMFGTMCKPLHAGRAAENGLRAARLAARGFTTREDVLDCAQGFADTQADEFRPQAAIEGLGTRWHTPDVLFKYHPACYGTHAPIEAARAIRANPAFDPAKVERVEVRVAPSCLKMCNIPDPTTGLEAKFSLRYTVGLGLAGQATGGLESYFDESVGREEVRRLLELCRVESVDDQKFTMAEVVVHQKDGLVLRERRDVGEPMRDLSGQWAKLRTKFEALTGPILGEKRAAEVVSLVEGIDGAAKLDPLLAATVR